jgi:signal peptidase II
MRRNFSLVRCVIVALLIFSVDVATKAWVSTASSQVGKSSLPYVLFSNFCGIDLQITHAINSGAAWGLFSDFPELLVFFRLVLIAGLILFLFVCHRRSSWNLPLSCIISGAIGNVYDYFHYGYVVDMIQFRFWGFNYPVFNIADSAIFIGSLWLLFLAYTEKSKNESM